MGSAVGQAQENRRQLFDTRLILCGKAGQRWAIEVKDANQLTVLDQRHHQLAVRRAVTGNMPGKRMHIFHPLGLPGRSGRAAHTTPERNTHAGDLTLKWPQYQFFIAIEIETGPVQIVQLIEQKRRELRAVGDKVALVGQQRFQLRAEHGIAIQAGAGVL